MILNFPSSQECPCHNIQMLTSETSQQFSWLFLTADRNVSTGHLVPRATNVQSFRTTDQNMNMKNNTAKYSANVYLIISLFVRG